MRNGLLIKYEDVAAYLAHEDNIQQAKFFSTFAQELRKVCGTHFHTETQMLNIIAEMTPEDVETLLIDPIQGDKP